MTDPTDPDDDNRIDVQATDDATSGDDPPDDGESIRQHAHEMAEDAVIGFAVLGQVPTEDNDLDDIDVTAHRWIIEEDIDTDAQEIALQHVCDEAIKDEAEDHPTGAEVVGPMSLADSLQ